MTISPPKLHPPHSFLSTYAPRLRTYNNALLVSVNPVQAKSRFSDESDEELDKALVVGLDINEPSQLQPIWRDWIARGGRQVTEKQTRVPAELPTALVPIRIDIEIPSFRPAAPFPTPDQAQTVGIDQSLPAYRPQDPTPAFRLQDFFMWNLHESLLTPDMFAGVLVNELDLPHDRKAYYTALISNQIRGQVEEGAAVVLHPLFNPEANSGSTREPGDEEMLSPDDAFRCVINLNLSLRDRTLTDRIEWSLLHPAGFAEEFGRITAADLGLSGEWASAIAHGIHEAVFRLKKEVAETGEMVVTNSYGTLEGANDAAEGTVAGWRFCNRLCDGWEPRVEVLDAEGLEKRDGDRERQLRRMRRENARGEERGRRREFETDRNWRCTHCGVWGSAVWATKDGPAGKKTLCGPCGLYYDKNAKLPIWSEGLFR